MHAKLGRLGKMQFFILHTLLQNRIKNAILLCYCVYRVYREITNEMFSLTQSKPYISKFLGPIKVIKKDLNIS